MSTHLSITYKNEDAETKWCPFSCASDHRHTHKIKKLIPGSQCLTSGCMAWIDETDHVYDISLGRCGLVNLS